MHENQTILTLIDLSPRKLGGFEEYCLTLTESLARRGWRSVLGFNALPPDWLLDRYVAAGAAVEQINMYAPRRERLSTLRDVIRRHDVDILHGTFLSIFSLDTVFIKRMGLKKLIFSDQTSRVRVPRSRSKDVLARTKNRLICPWIDRIVADAQYVKQDLIDSYSVDPRKIEVVYNGVNIRRFDAQRTPSVDKTSLGIPAHHRVVTTVANCIPEKGLDVFLNAARQVRGSQPDVTFVLVGDGRLLEELQEMARSLGIADATRFLGLRSDVHEIMALSDVFVLCSMWEEAFALVLLEAMASGLPVVATRIGAIPESILDGVTGILFPRGDADAAAAAIIALLENDELRHRMGTAGVERVRAHFTLEHWVNNTIDLYDRVLDG